MIVSHTGKLIFFHNPKVAGASVHRSLETFHDNTIVGWGVASDGRQLAHYGIDEFAMLFPEVWEQIGGYHIFSLYRDPQQRFFSSFAQYSRMNGEIDIRFATPEANRSFLFRVIDRLAKSGSAEAILPAFDLTPFRPQWIYGRSENHPVQIAAYPMREIEAMYLAIEARLGSPLNRDKINEREAIDLPAPLAAVMQRGDLIRKVAGMPGAKQAKTLLKRAFGTDKQSDKLALSDQDANTVSQFVGSFYARDFAWLASMQASKAR